MDEDRSAALAWQFAQAEHCSGCGQRLSESTDPALADQWDLEPVRCFVCEARALEGDRFRDRGGSLDGLMFRTTRMP